MSYIVWYVQSFFLAELQTHLRLGNEIIGGIVQDNKCLDLIGQRWQEFQPISSSTTPIQHVFGEIHNIYFFSPHW
jgi:hypothetical protein